MNFREEFFKRMLFDSTEYMLKNRRIWASVVAKFDVNEFDKIFEPSTFSGNYAFIGSAIHSEIERLFPEFKNELKIEFNLVNGWILVCKIDMYDFIEDTAYEIKTTVFNNKEKESDYNQMAIYTYVMLNKNISLNKFVLVKFDPKNIDIIEYKNIKELYKKGEEIISKLNEFLLDYDEKHNIKVKIEDFTEPPIDENIQNSDIIQKQLKNININNEKS